MAKRRKTCKCYLIINGRFSRCARTVDEGDHGSDIYCLVHAQHLSRGNMYDRWSNRITPYSEPTRK